jgi:hypothetical protein
MIPLKAKDEVEHHSVSGRLLSVCLPSSNVTSRQNSSFLSAEPIIFLSPQYFLTQSIIFLAIFFTWA